MSHSLFSAAEQSGMRLSLLPVLYQRAGFKDPSIGARQRRFHHELDEYLALLNRVEALSARVEGTRIGVAPHSLRAVPSCTSSIGVQNEPKHSRLRVAARRSPSRL